MPTFTVYFYEEVRNSVEIVAPTAQIALDKFRLGQWQNENAEIVAADIDYEDLEARLITE